MFTPLSAQQWNYETAAHLLNRAGFGGTPGEIEAARGKGLDATVRDLVSGSGIVFEDRGEHELKGVGERRIYAVAEV